MLVNERYYLNNMTIHKCDKCKKVIKGDRLDIRIGWDYVVMCRNCASFLLDFLDKEKLLAIKTR